MTSISGKRQLLHDDVSRRLMDSERNKGVPTGYFVFSLLLIPVCVFSGMFIAEFDYLMSLDQYERESSYNYSVDNYTIMFVSPEENSDMKGNDGFTYEYRDDDIFIRKSLLLNENWDRISLVCHHELLHNLGLGSEVHDKVYLYESQISDPVCEELMERIR